jgi:protein required for attachment to host cells
MNNLVVVVDGTRARLFTADGPLLVEQLTLVNPVHRMPERERYSESKPGRRDSPGGPSQTFDDHRAKHDREYERRFAKKIANETFTRVDAGVDRIVLVSNAPMLGLLRPELEGLAARGAELVELEKNWAGWTVHEIHDALDKKGLVTK